MSETSFYNPEQFQKELEGHYSQISSEGDLKKIRDISWDQFLEIGLPSKNEEAYRYIKLRKLYNQTFLSPTIASVSSKEIKPHILPECEQACVVFVNGCYQKHLSTTASLPSNVVIIPLSEATQTYGAFLNHHWSKGIREETDPFAILNSALHRDGLFIYLPPKTVLETPIQILHIIDPGLAPMLIVPRIHFFAGAAAQSDFVTTYAELSGHHYFFNQAFDILVEEDAHLRITNLNWKLSPEAWNLNAFRATMKRNSAFRTVSINSGCATLRDDYHVVMKGENGEADLNGVWLLKEKNESHTHVVIDHQAPNCRSRQLFKGVLNDSSSSSFEGKILVRQAADKTDAFQLNNNILLSDHANADSKPNLEIFSPDVKASHGATVGQIDGEQLFYLKARGLSDEAAKSLLINGFCQDVMDLTRANSVKESAHHFIHQFLTSKGSHG